jgi:hypothetical protein
MFSIEDSSKILMKMSEKDYLFGKAVGKYDIIMSSNEQNSTYQSPQASSFNGANPEARISMVATMFNLLK